MLEDGSRIDSGATLNFDVCIVGAGPAGLTLAAQLDGGPYRVCLLEAGGMTPDPAHQALADGLVDLNDDCYENPGFLHDVTVGGTAHRWCIEAGDDVFFRMGKLSPADFERRSWLPHSGWPITAADLEPWYDRALAVCGVDPGAFDPQRWTDQAHQPIASVDGQVDSSVFVFARRAVFTEELPARLARSAATTLIHDAACVEIESEGGGARVTRLRVRSLSGRQFHVAARAVALTTGAFDVARLLLASRADVPAGLGNGRDLVGRYFTDHQIVKAGSIQSARPDLPARLAYYDIRSLDGASGTGTLAVADKTLDQEQILSSGMMLVPTLNPWSPGWAAQHLWGRETTNRSPALASAMEVRQALKHGQRPPQIGRHLIRMAAGADDLAFALTRIYEKFPAYWSIDRGGWSQPIQPGQPEVPGRPEVKGIEAFQLCEQAPDPENRITLSDEVDAVGMPKPKVHFRWSDLDRHSVRRSQEIVSHTLEEAGVGRLRRWRRRGDPLVRQMTAHHPAGTARMSADAATGVVDADCKVHGTANLFVASAAVFPTAGFAPPTLTVLALATRVAEAITDLLASGVGL